MRLLVRATLAFLILPVLVACGADGDTKDGDKSDSSTAAKAKDEGYPTDASVADYCMAYKGEDVSLDPKTATIGDLRDYLQKGADKVVETGVPADFTAAQRKAFDEQIKQFDVAINALEDLDKDEVKIADAREDEALKKQIGESIDVETPQTLRDYSAKNCA